MVVQWSAHPILHILCIRSLYAKVFLSLKDREVVGSNPTHGVLFGILVSFVVTGDELCNDVRMIPLFKPASGVQFRVSGW